MDFTLNEAQDELGGLARKILAERESPWADLAAAGVLGAGAIASFGTPEQQERWARPAGQGSVVLTAALAEEDGDDFGRPSCRAVRAADGSWVLSGAKTAVDHAPQADL